MPDPFLEVRIHDLSQSPGLIGLCADYERGEWRMTQFVDHIMEWLPEFSLSQAELKALAGSNNWVPLVRRAAQAVYSTDKFKRRGEFGELLLHIAIRQVFQTEPAVSKIYYKSADNDTVKGFDCVHVTAADDGLELWLGEVKFYTRANAAIADVVKELQAHTQTDYLRREFILIGNKIDDSWPHAEQLKALLAPGMTLDKVFKRLCVPVLLTYDSAAVADHTICDEAYLACFKNEIREHYKSFTASKLPGDVRIHLFLLPLKSKAELNQKLHEKLKTWQNI